MRGDLFEFTVEAGLEEAKREDIPINIYVDIDLNGDGIKHVHDHLMRSCLDPHEKDHRYNVNEHEGEGNVKTDGQQDEKSRKEDNQKYPPLHLIHLSNRFSTKE